MVLTLESNAYSLSAAYRNLAVKLSHPSLDDHTPMTSYSPILAGCIPDMGGAIGTDSTAPAAPLLSKVRQFKVCPFLPRDAYA